MEYYSARIKNEILPFVTTWMGPWEYYAKWNKSDRERQILYDLTDMWNLKKEKKNKISELNPNQNKHLDTENRVVVTRVGGGEGEMGKGGQLYGDPWSTL